MQPNKPYDCSSCICYGLWFPWETTYTHVLGQRSYLICCPCSSMLTCFSLSLLLLLLHTVCILNIKGAYVVEKGTSYPFNPWILTSAPRHPGEHPQYSDQGHNEGPVCARPGGILVPDHGMGMSWNMSTWAAEASSCAPDTSYRVSSIMTMSVFKILFFF